VIAASAQVYEPVETMSTPIPAQFAELYERHYEAVFRAALRVTGNPSDAEDVLQTVFVRVLSRAEDEAAAQAPAAYFRRAAVNAAVDLLRRRAVHAETAYDDAAPRAAVERPALLKEQLRRAVATLDSEDATLFLLRHVVSGMGLQEAIDAPMFHHDSFPGSFHPRGMVPGVISLEDRYPADVVEDLIRRGHDVGLQDPWSLGRMCAVARDPATGLLSAGANPRGMQGYAVGR